MSVYDASHSGDNDSDRTITAKKRLERIITEQMRIRGFKTFIKFEVPAIFLEPKPVCYHLDLGVLFRSVSEYDFYHFIAIEIDDKGHRTLRHDKKDDARDDSFFTNKGIMTCRIPLEKIFEEKQDEAKLFDKWIWSEISPAYIISPVSNKKQEIWSEINRVYSIQLKENAFTSCKDCSHKAHQHSLTGCNFRNTNKAKLKCNCKNPYFISDA